MMVKRKGRGDPMLLIQPIRPAVTQKKGEILTGIFLDASIQLQYVIFVLIFIKKMSCVSGPFLKSSKYR